MKTLKDLGDLKGKRVLVRADFNVPLDGTTITDDGRIKAALPTIKALREEGAKVILMAHLGRPKGKVVPELSLAPVAARLGELLGIEVPLAEDTYGEDAQAKVAAMNDGDVVLLQNVRYNPEETSKDPEERSAYAKKIAALGEAFVSDGFGVVHRAQGSNNDVAADLPAAAGLLVEKEVKALSRATVEPERPLTVVLGGSKVSDKLGVIENLLDKANRLVIGGGMVYTFLKAKGLEVSTSLLEEDQVETVKGYINRAEQNGVELVLPTDIVVNPVFPKSDEDIAPEVVAADAIPADKMGLDTLAATAKDLAARAKENKLTADEYKGSTITVSNLGMFGIETFTPIINQPDSVIVGVCAIEDELQMDDEGKLSKHQVMRLSVTLDHRTLDGAVVAKFEMDLRDILQNPISIVL